MSAWYDRNRAYSERISGESSRTSANGDVVLDGTLGSGSAGEAARVDAAVVLASLVRRALGVGDAVACWKSFIRVSWQFDSP